MFKHVNLRISEIIDKFSSDKEAAKRKLAKIMNSTFEADRQLNCEQDDTADGYIGLCSFSLISLSVYIMASFTLYRQINEFLFKRKRMPRLLCFGINDYSRTKTNLKQMSLLYLKTFCCLEGAKDEFKRVKYGGAKTLTSLIHRNASQR